MKFTDSNFSDLYKNYKDYLPFLQEIHSEFGGPSVYFHHRALVECRGNYLSEAHLELIYAALASWGMHRMGKTKTKLVDFKMFQESILKSKALLLELKNLRLQDIESESDKLFNIIQELCFTLKVSASNSKIVGNSKALAHILPDLVPPIDRQYTLRFFTHSVSNFKESDERVIFDHILKRSHQFIKILVTDKNVIIDSTFNTSYPKIIDNLIMAYMKSKKNGT